MNVQALTFPAVRCGMSRLLGVALLSCFSLAPSSFGALVIDIVPESPTIQLTGGTQTFSLTVRAAADAGVQTLAAYNIPLDFANPVDGLPPGWTVDDVLPITEIPPGGAFDWNPDPDDGAGDPVPGDADILVNDSTNLLAPQSLQLTTTPTNLFDVVIQLDGSAVPGDYTATVVTSSTLISFFNGDFVEIEPASVSGANITLVPEPSGILASLLAGSALFVRHRNRRSRTC